jgi:hypothetical protein
LPPSARRALGADFYGFAHSARFYFVTAVIASMISRCAAT